MRPTILDLLGRLLEYPDVDIKVVYGSFIVNLAEEHLRVVTWADGWHVYEADRVTTFNYEDGEWTREVEEIEV